MNIDKNLNQAQSIRPIEGYDALPLSGPGRWAHVYGGMTLYTNDDNVVFARGGKGTLAKSTMFQAMWKLHQAGKTAGEAFDILRLESDAVSGDLSELA